jgi:hypothetical protein
MALSYVLAVIPTGKVWAAGNTCTWTGGGEDSNWSTADNWEDCGSAAPTNNDNLVFPSIASRKTNSNDLTDLVINQLTIFDSYHISGDNFTITNALNSDVSLGTSTTIANDVTLGPNTTPGDDFTIFDDTSSFNTFTIQGQVTLAIGSGNLAVTGGSGKINFGNTTGSANAINIDSNSFTFGSSSDFTVNDNIHVSGSTLLFCGSSTCLGDDSNEVIVDGSSSLDVYNDFTFSNPITCSTTGSCIYTNSLGTNVIVDSDITLDGLTTIGTQGTAGMSIDLNGVISGGGNLTLGVGEVNVNNSNTFIGSVTIAGDITLNSSQALGDPDNDIVLFEGAPATTLKLNGITFPYDTTLNDNTALRAIGSGTSQVNGALTISGDGIEIQHAEDATLALNGTIEMQTDFLFEGETSGAGAFWINAPISGSGHVTYENGSIIKSVDDSYTGAATVEANTTVTSGQAGAYGPTGNIVLVESGGTIVLAGTSDYTLSASVTGSGTVRMINSGVRQFTTMEEIDFTGTVEVETGSTYRIEGDNAAQSSINIDGGTLKGNGTIANATLSSGTIAPGNSPGLINITGDLTLSASPSTFDVEINGKTAGTDYDQVVVGDTAELNNAKLTISLGFQPSVGDSFTILKANVINGHFDGLSDGDSISVNGTTFVIDYVNDSSGEDSVVLHVAGASASSGLLAITGQSTISSILIGITLVMLAVTAKFFKPRYKFRAK